MKIRYILQLKRNKFWEDLAFYRDKSSVLVVYHNMRKEGLHVRIVEVYYI